ncbi:hypothetical protein L1887_16218 [Cichorium endivia]|nr:hypothetical protein L1887_16218 [Cichorium endivia]
MVFLEYLVFFFPLIFISFLTVLYRCQNKNSIEPTNWPVLGMFPATILHAHRGLDYVTDVLACSGGTYLHKGPWLANMDMLFTANPSDINHILSKNSPNYPKGHQFRKIFDVFGDGIINADGDLWEFYRRTFMSLLKHPSFQSLTEMTIWNKVERGLLPVLEHGSKQGVEMDLQEIFQRFFFDTICILLLDFDPQSMSVDFPHVPCEKALSQIGEAIFHRYIMPQRFSKLKQLFRIGTEKQLTEASKILDRFIYKCLAQKQKEFTSVNHELREEKFILLTKLMREFKDHSGTRDPNKFLRDTLLNLMFAGKDTTTSALSWFFYLLAANPIVEDKIREELHTQLETETDGKWKPFCGKVLCKLVYLHGALSEALRLYPPIPLQNRTPLQKDTLPSGRQVDYKTTIILSYYSMGRMKSIWGEDCMEFKPERWVSVAGGINHQPSYKFPAFNTGPTFCLGKDMSFSQMKIVAATIIYHYHVELVERHPPFPSCSIINKMKNGLKVRLIKLDKVK